MSDSFVSDHALKLLGKALHVSVKRHRLITSNIANVDTIGYQPKDLDFKAALNREMSKNGEGLARTHPGHVTGQPGADLAGRERPFSGNPYDQGQVNIDVEMNSLVENNIKYRSSVEMLIRKMGLIRHAIVEGGR